MNRDRTMIRTWAALAGVALATACGGGDSPTPTAPPTAPDPPRATSVAVNPATAELDVGETVQLAAVVRDQNSNVMAGASVTWMSGAGTVATVNTTGLVTGIAEGTATITASAGSAQGTAQITVVTAPVVSVEVSPSAETIAVGATLQLTAEAFDANGQAVAGAEFSWESSDASVATVDATGLVTGIAEGTATITASAGSAQGTAQITVVTAPVVSVEVSPSAETIAVGATLQLTAEAFDANGQAVAGAEFSWESSDASVATVDATGLVTGIAEGTATITASAGSAQGTAQITVVTAPVVSVEVSPSAETIAVGATLQLTAEAFDANGQAVAGAEFSWESSDASVATVDATGLVTGIAEGTATITGAHECGRRPGMGLWTATVTVVEEVVAPDDHGNSIATATPVAIGATVQGVLTEGDEDYFEIPVPTDGFRLGVFTEGNTDTYGTLFDQNGVSLSSDDDSGEALNFHIVQVLDAGTYYLNIVGLFGDTGDYSLVVEEVAPDDHGNVIATATPVAIGATVQGVLTEGDEDYFEIPVPTDGFRLGVFTEGNTDTYGRLFDQNGVSLSSDDDSGEALNFHIVQVLDAGTYYLSIVGLFGDTGDYSLVVEEVAPDDHGNVIATATPVAIGATVQGVLETEGDEDYFEIPVPTDGFRLGVFTEGQHGHLREALRPERRRSQR